MKLIPVANLIYLNFEIKDMYGTKKIMIQKVLQFPFMNGRYNNNHIFYPSIHKVQE